MPNCESVLIFKLPYRRLRREKRYEVYFSFIVLNESEGNEGTILDYATVIFVYAGGK